MDATHMITKSVEQSYISFGQSVVEALSTKYEFDLEEALEMLNMSVKITRIGAPKKKTMKEKTMKEKPKVPNTIIPFCGEVMKDCCQGIRPNHGLFTQCQMTKLNGKEYCKTCNKQAEACETNKPKNGDINDRVNNKDWRSPDGKTPKNYGNVMTKLNINRTQAEEAANMMGWTIPETEYEIKKNKSGRPKSPATSDTDDEAPAKKRGRPVKKPKTTVVKSDTGDDVIANLMSNMELDDDTSSEEEPNETDNIISEPTTEEGIAEITETLDVGGEEETKKEEADLTSSAKKETIKQKKEKPALTAEEKAEKKKATQKKRKETMMRKQAEKEAEEAKKEPEAELERETDEEVDDLESQPDTSDDEEPGCDEFEFKGTKYYKDSKTNELYTHGDPENTDLVGVYDEENQCINPVKE